MEVETLALKHNIMKNLWKSGKTQCTFCGKTYFKDSETFNAHMLFDHGFFMPTCSTKQTKKLEWATINGFAKREQRLQEKRDMQKGLRLKRRSILVTFRKFWQRIDKEYVE